MKIRRTDREAQAIRLDMTAMIDVVFLLLVFFVMTFKTPIYEGDFGINMPMASNTQDMMTKNPDEPLVVILSADENNDLASMTIEFNNDNLTYNFDSSNPDGIFKSLNEYVIGIVGSQQDASAADIEAELEIDANLKYNFTVKTIEAISGYKVGDEINKLIEKINFRDTGDL